MQAKKMKKRSFIAMGVASALTAFAATMQLQNTAEQKQDAVRAESTAAKWRDIHALPFDARVQRLEKETATLAIFYDVGNKLRSQLEAIQESLDADSGREAVSARRLHDGMSAVYTYYGIVRNFYKPEQDEAVRPLIRAVHSLTADVASRTAASDPELSIFLNRLENYIAQFDAPPAQSGLTMNHLSP